MIVNVVVYPDAHDGEGLRDCGVAPSSALAKTELTVPRDTGTLLGALVLYERRILPLVRSELRHWRTLADAIPNQVLREAALFSIDDKGSNAEATAVFAILAPRAQRRRVVRASVALQTAVDYLDTLGEQPGSDPLGDGLALHRA